MARRNCALCSVSERPPAAAMSAVVILFPPDLTGSHHPFSFLLARNVAGDVSLRDEVTNGGHVCQPPRIACAGMHGLVIRANRTRPKYRDWCSPAAAPPR